MKISELKAGQGKVDVEVVVKSKAEPRTFNKYGKDLRVCNAVVSDDSGDISFSLWNDDIDKINIGDKVKVTNGYVSEFNGQKQLTSGKFGKMEVISGSSAVDSESADSGGENSGEVKEAKPKKAKKSSEEEKKIDDVAF